MRSKKVKVCPYSITKSRVLELVPVIGSQPVGDVSHKPDGRLRYFPPGLKLPPQPLSGLLPILLLGEQRHDGYEQVASALGVLNDYALYKSTHSLLPNSVATAI